MSNVIKLYTTEAEIRKECVQELFNQLAEVEDIERVYIIAQKSDGNVAIGSANCDAPKKLELIGHLQADAYGLLDYE